MEKNFVIVRYGTDYLMYDIPNPFWSSNIKQALHFTKEEAEKRMDFFRKYSNLEEIIEI